MTTTNLRHDESVAAVGARWVTLAFMTVGALNYAYALLLTRLLSVRSYSSFAAGQGLVLWTSTVATVVVPWVLAQALARATSQEERSAATRFAMLTSIGSGIFAGAITGIIGLGFASPSTSTVLAVSVLAIFMGTTTSGWLQGVQRMRSLSVLYVCENVVKVTSGMLLVAYLGLRDLGALAGFGIGGVVMLLRWPRPDHTPVKPWVAAFANRFLWRQTVRVVSAQGLVSCLIASDVVLVALLPASRAMAASYQASVTLSRVPVFVATAVSTAFFPSVARSAAPGELAARAVRMYVAVGLPVVAVLVTIPDSVIGLMFPSQYFAIAGLLRITALSGFCAGLISLLTAFFQASDDYKFIGPLICGLVLYIVALLGGWLAYGVVGLAVGSVGGELLVVLMLSIRLVRQHGFAVLAHLPIVEPIIAFAFLDALQAYVLVWMLFVAIVAFRAKRQFVRPGARHRRLPGWAAPKPRVADVASSGAAVLCAAAWRGVSISASKKQLSDALVVARRNQMEGRLARVYADRMPDVVAEVAAARGAFLEGLEFAQAQFRSINVPVVVFFVNRPSNYVCGQIDVFIRERHIASAIRALDGPYDTRRADLYDRGCFSLMPPGGGPRLCLHVTAERFGLPGVSAEHLFYDARLGRRGYLVPSPWNYLRMRVARIAFESNELTMADLLAIRTLIAVDVLRTARWVADNEGWRRTFDAVVSVARDTVSLLDGGHDVQLPLSMLGPTKCMRLRRNGKVEQGAFAPLKRPPEALPLQTSTLTGGN